MTAPQHSEEVVNRGEIEDKSYNAFRTLYVLLGGTGMKVGMKLRRRVLEAHGRPQLPFQEYLWLDTDKGDQKTQTIDETEAVARRLELPDDDIVNLSLPFERVRHLRDHIHDYPWLEEWLDLDMLRDLGDSARAEDGAAQIRSLGRLAFTEKFQEFRGKFETRFDRLSRPDLDREAQSLNYDTSGSDTEIAIICSLGGGTGAGCFIEAARVMRELASARGQGSVNIKAYLILPGVYRRRLKSNQKAWNEVQANACAALMELNALTALNREGFSAPPVWIDDFRVEKPVGDPFNQIYLMEERNDAGQSLEGEFDQDAFGMLADALYFDFERSAFGACMRSHRCNVKPHLQSTSYLSFPVNDGTEAAGASPDEGNRKYVFRFPNAFGAFGLARIPFERQRLRRAAAAWFARQMLVLLVSAPETSMSRAEVERLVVRPALDDAGLSLDQILNRILQDGEGQGTFDQEAARLFSDGIEPLRRRVEEHFTAKGVGPDERLERLEHADEFARRLSDDVRKLVTESVSKVRRNLASEGAREDFGPHLLAIEDVQRTILSDFKDRFGSFVFGLLGKPRTHGYTVAEAACQILQEQLGAMLKGGPRAPDDLSPAALSYEVSRKVRQAVDRKDAAEALWLPVYGGLARSHFRRENERLLGDTANDYARDARQYLADIEGGFEAWTQATYRAVAGTQSKELFELLRTFVGDEARVEAGGAEGEEAKVTATGLRNQLLQFRRAAEESAAFFEGMYDSYANRKPFARNGEDLTPYSGLQKAVEDVLTGNELRGAGYSQKSLLEDQWRAFFEANKGFLTEGDTQTLEAGIGHLKDRAVAQARDRTKWDRFQTTLETWTYQILLDRQYLEGEDAIGVLQRQSGGAEEQMKHIARGAAPWLRFDQARGRPSTLAPLALVGARSAQAKFLDDWRRRADGAFKEPQVIENESGSVILYSEKMVFPLYYVAAISELFDQYRRVQESGKHNLSRRHTTKHYLQLPPILPPRDPDEAARWFRVGRLSLEAVLLGVFEADKAGTVKYEYEDDKDGVRRQVSLPAVLAAITNTLRLNNALRTSIEGAVATEVTKNFNDPDRAYQALRLAYWMQNDAFGDTGYAYLEHELAKSLFQRWREIAVRRAGHKLDEQLPTIRPMVVEEFTTLSAVGSWALRSECDGIRRLASRRKAAAVSSPEVW